MHKQLIDKYIIRVYALIINSNKEILISDEFQMNNRMTKFPGGGMEFGEGTIDCLEREAVEEFGQEIEVLDHFYTTDFFQQTEFYNKGQLMSIYYFSRFKGEINFKLSNKIFDFDKEENGEQSFRWVKISELNSDDFTFPIDQKVVNLIKQKFQN